MQNQIFEPAVQAVFNYNNVQTRTLPNIGLDQGF